MSQVSRRNFLKLAGTGGALVAGGGLAALKLTQAGRSGDVFTFRAVTGLPKEPLPAYATYMLDGHVDLSSGTGVVTRTLHAGAPEAMSPITFAELTRDLQVTSVRGTPPRLTLHAVLDGDLRAGESRHATIIVDQSRGEVRAPFIGGEVEMALNA